MMALDQLINYIETQLYDLHCEATKSLQEIQTINSRYNESFSSHSNNYSSFSSYEPVISFNESNICKSQTNSSNLSSESNGFKKSKNKADRRSFSNPQSSTNSFNINDKLYYNGLHRQNKKESDIQKQSEYTFHPQINRTSSIYANSRSSTPIWERLSQKPKPPTNPAPPKSQYQRGAGSTSGSITPSTETTKFKTVGSRYMEYGKQPKKTTVTPTNDFSFKPRINASSSHIAEYTIRQTISGKVALPNTNSKTSQIQLPSRLQSKSGGSSTTLSRQSPSISPNEYSDPKMKSSDVGLAIKKLWAVAEAQSKSESPPPQPQWKGSSSSPTNTSFAVKSDISSLTQYDKVDYHKVINEDKILSKLDSSQFHTNDYMPNYSGAVHVPSPASESASDDEPVNFSYHHSIRPQSSSSSSSSQNKPFVPPFIPRLRLPLKV